MNANAIALEALKSLYRGYVNTLESARDRILSLGGQCDPLDKMEASDPWLISARAAIAALEAEPQGWRDIASAPTEAPQEFESVQGRALALAWAEGWAQCRDAEYVGEEAENEAFNQSHTLAKCLHADQTRFQGGLSNDQLRRAWGVKLPNVIPTDEQLTAFALGIEVSAAPPGTTPADTEKD